MPQFNDPRDQQAAPTWLRLAVVSQREGIPARTLEREIARGNLPLRTLKTGVERGTTFVHRGDYEAWRQAVTTNGDPDERTS